MKLRRRMIFIIIAMNILFGVVVSSSHHESAIRARQRPFQLRRFFRTTPSQLVADISNPPLTISSFLTSHPSLTPCFHVCYSVLAAETLTRASEIAALIYLKGSQRHSCPLHRLAQECPKIPIYVVILANFFVFTAWRISELWFRNLRWMLKHFTLSCYPLERQRRPHTALTHAFSQYRPMHFVLNMCSLTIFRKVVPYLGSYRKFFYVYISAIYASQSVCRDIFNPLAETTWFLDVEQKVFTSIFSFRYHLERHIRRDAVKRVASDTSRTRPKGGYGLGASGVISTLMALDWLYHTENLWINNNKPLAVAAVALFFYFVISEIFRINADDGISHGTHAGGLCFGGIVWLSHVVGDMAKSPAMKLWSGIQREVATEMFSSTLSV